MNERLRILQVNTKDQGSGGAASSAWNLHQGFHQQGVVSWLAVGRKFSQDTNTFLIPNENNRPAWTRLIYSLMLDPSDKSRSVRNWLGYKLAWLGEPKRLLDRAQGKEDFHHPGCRYLLDLPPQRPNLVHCHNLHGNYFDLRTLPWLSHQAPIILNLRDAWLLSGHCSIPIGCTRWKSGCGHCPDLTIYPPIRRDATAFNWQRKKEIYDNSCLYITAPSQWLIDKTQESMLSGRQYRVIPNAIDLANFKPGEKDEARKILGLPLDADIILLIAHSQFKDFETMISALAKIGNAGSEKEQIFVCLGKEGKEESLGTGKILYMGYERDQKHMTAYYQSADVYIHAAFGEAFGKTIIEAMACGTPVVATAVEAIPELIEDGVTGLLVPAQDANAMYVAVERLLTDAQLYDNISRTALADSRQKYGLTRQVNDFLEWYREVQQDWLDWNKQTV